MKTILESLFQGTPGNQGRTLLAFDSDRAKIPANEAVGVLQHTITVNFSSSVWSNLEDEIWHIRLKFSPHNADCNEDELSQTKNLQISQNFKIRRILHSITFQNTSNNFPLTDRPKQSLLEYGFEVSH